MLTNFPNGVSSYGIPIIGSGGIPSVKGKVFFVDNSSVVGGVKGGNDSNKNGSFKDPFKTFAYAYSKCVSNRGDMIVLMGNSTHDLTVMATTSINRLTVIGMDGSPGRFYGQTAKVAIGVTTAATDIAAVKNTGVRNTFINIKFISNNTVAESLYSFVDGGEYGLFINCEFYESANLAVTGAADFVCNGDSAQFIGCTFGSLASPRVGAVIRPCVLFTKGLAGAGKVARDILFKDCRFWINASDTANRFIYGANATDIERIAEFDNCKFINNGASAFVPAQNVAFGASLTVGSVLLNRCTSINAATAMSTTTGVFVDGAAPTAATSGIAVQAA